MHQVEGAMRLSVLRQIACLLIRRLAVLLDGGVGIFDFGDESAIHLKANAMQEGRGGTM
jgi:hypothetical protein